MVGRCFAHAGIALALLALFAGTPAHAHGIGDGGTGLLAGFAHPFTGWDHAVAMVAVGIWAAQCGGAARWMLPTGFLAAMAVGGALGGIGVVLPAVESGIALSLLALGIAIAAAARAAPGGGLGRGAGLARFHGHAHGTEMPGGASPALHALGFLVATAALHAAGLGGGGLAARLAGNWGPRLVGAAISLGGAFLVAA
jgi:urease accessory protein